MFIWLFFALLSPSLCVSPVFDSLLLFAYFMLKMVTQKLVKTNERIAKYTIIEEPVH